MHNILQIPPLSPTMDKGNISSWENNERDKIEVGDVICDIETHKATLDLESMEEWYLDKVLVPTTSKDLLNWKTLAITVENPEDIPKFANISADGFSSKQPIVKMSKENIDNK